MTIQERSSHPKQERQMDGTKNHTAVKMHDHAYPQVEGLRLERSLLEIIHTWQELESDPGLFSLLCDDLIGPNKVDVTEIFEISADLKAQVGEGHVYGFILLYLYQNGQRGQRGYDKELEKLYIKDPAIVNNMFYSIQEVKNACATYASLSILLNSQNLSLGPFLDEFKAFTAGMTPKAKGYAVGNSAELAAFHNRRAPVSPAYSVIEEKASTSTSKPRRSSKKEVTRTEVKQYHFISYVPINGQLIELDGVKESPISHGAISPDEDWMVKCGRVIQDRMAQTVTQSRKMANTGHFTMLAVRQCLRTTCIAEAAVVQTQLLDRLATVKNNKNTLETELKFPLANAAKLVTFFDEIRHRQYLTDVSSNPANVSWTDLPTKTEDMSSKYEALINSTNEILGGPATVPIPEAPQEAEVELATRTDRSTTGQAERAGGVLGKLAQEQEKLKLLEERTARSRTGSESATASDSKSASDRTSPSVSLNFSTDASTSTASTSGGLTEESNDSNETATEERRLTRSRAGSVKQIRGDAKVLARSLSFSHAPHTKGESPTLFELLPQGRAAQREANTENLEEVLKGVKEHISVQNATSKRSKSKAQLTKPEASLAQHRPSRSVSVSKIVNGTAASSETSPGPAEEVAHARRRSSRVQLPKETPLIAEMEKVKPAKTDVKAVKPPVTSAMSTNAIETEEPESEGAIRIVTSKRKSLLIPATGKPVTKKPFTSKPSADKLASEKPVKIPPITIKNGRLVLATGATDSRAGPKAAKAPHTEPTRRSSRNSNLQISEPILIGGAKVSAVPRSTVPSTSAVQSAVVPEEETAGKEQTVAAAVAESDGRVTRSRKRSQQSLTVALELVRDMEEAESEKVQTPLEPPTKKRKGVSRSESLEEMKLQKEKEAVKANVERLERVRDCLQNMVTALTESSPLEKERVRWYMKIVEENERKQKIQEDAQDREFDIEPYIALMLTRMLQLNLLTEEERRALIPKDCRKFLDQPDRTASEEKTATASAKKNRKKK
ncbi:hypothetical protein RvY_08672-2 [Ramazzottius varieornatus]|uniref:ubiquitinyl hydrolase 1 n=1 Tax=Ramazzottius varieornatus TaxID=947166 RepID=A0A1D1VFV3_RAMVA|nr:hypothetical protein RvY_08672-2 [Ramazzottius varieornatus]